jgi:hypothetical protein
MRIWRWIIFESDECEKQLTKALLDIHKEAAKDKRDATLEAIEAHIAMVGQEPPDPNASHHHSYSVGKSMACAWMYGYTRGTVLRLMDAGWIENRPLP